MNEIIPPDVQDFIIRYVHSVAQLEALLLLRGSPEKNWRANDIARRLYISELETADALGQLCKDKFLRLSDGGYHYEPKPDHKRSIDRLASIYSRHLIPVTNMIHGKAHHIRQFSDAFRLRRDDE